MMVLKYLEAMQKRLSCEEVRRLQAVYAPQVVGVPPSNAWMDMCAMPDGEIRHYGHRDGKRVYISSRDGGFTWKEYGVDDLYAMCSGLQSPYTGAGFSPILWKKKANGRRQKRPYHPKACADGRRFYRMRARAAWCAG